MDRNQDFASQPFTAFQAQAFVHALPGGAAALAAPSKPRGDDDGGISGDSVMPEIVNIQATVNVQCRLDLKTIAMHARNAEYNPRRFSAVIMRIKEPKTTALIFASGKVVVTGAKSESDSRLAARKFGRTLQKLGYEPKLTEYTVHNMTSKCDVQFPIHLERLASHHPGFSSYEPELFPGLIYKMIRPKMVILMFVSGKVVLTGAKRRQDIDQAWEMIYPIIQGSFPPVTPIHDGAIVSGKGTAITPAISAYYKPPIRCGTPYCENVIKGEVERQPSGYTLEQTRSSVSCLINAGGGDLVEV
ncbi:hypothetical protein DL766_000020 [Monosporascus sp. MC13-8B]|uniref:TATA-box-binding protein n=1 Tax=Monosporascus cannonballus TaxID=155416 RepID=A0ABY0HME0_9PEZI|nr:hypothetical protein DL762_000389 [Monosporascus cannonballus]RYP01207.1 hypothetical protein DL763_000332 [Monosporascus cannonballus]RYP40219.1 hypothetical protein DL766_000020 [Monosporascus sp. MC13-8B]